MVSINPANNGETIYIILKPKINRSHAKQIIAEPNPTTLQRNTARNAQRFSLRNFIPELGINSLLDKY